MALLARYDYERLLAERQLLLEKLFSGTMTYSDKCQLTFIRWQLDNIYPLREMEVLK